MTLQEAASVFELIHRATDGETKRRPVGVRVEKYLDRSTFFFSGVLYVDPTTFDRVNEALAFITARFQTWGGKQWDTVLEDDTVP